MKITGGYLKGQTLFTPTSKEIRPLRTKIRKSLFDIIGHDLTGFKILDLFCGTGALGIEALSRGAEFVVFVDASEKSQKLVLKNLAKFKLLEKARFYKKPLPQFLSVLAKKQLVFDLIFITPPYLKGLSLKTLENIPKAILHPSTIIIVEEHTQVSLPEKTEIFNLFKKKIYGETSLWFYSLKDSA